MRRRLTGRVILLTGASRGIGRRVALAIQSHGVRLAIAGRSADELESLAVELRKAGTEVAVLPCDLTDAISRERLVADVVARFGSLDVLVNAAGVASFGEFATSTEEILRKVMAINFFAAAELTRLCVPHLVRSWQVGPAEWRPAVLHVVSVCGRVGIPSLSEHSGSKHALVGLCEALRCEFERNGIDVLMVLPGVVRTDDMNRHLLCNEGKIYLDFEGAQRPESAAATVVRSLVRNRKESASGFVGWWAWFGKRAWPRGLRWIMARKAAKFARRTAGA